MNRDAGWWSATVLGALVCVVLVVVVVARVRAGGAVAVPELVELAAGVATALGGLLGRLGGDPVLRGDARPVDPAVQ